MWLYGINPVRELLRAPRRGIRRVVLRQGLRKPLGDEFTDLARRGGIRLDRLGRAAFDARFGRARTQGVAAEILEQPPVELDELLGFPAQRGEPALFLLLDGVEDPRNLGAIVRTAEATGVHGIVLPSRRSAPLGATAARAAAGAMELMRFSVVANIKSAIDAMQRRQIMVFAVEAGADAAPWRADLRADIGLVLGGEGAGVRSTVLARCDGRLSLPQRGRLNSLNVSVAAGMVLYEVLRQRTPGA